MTTTTKTRNYRQFYVLIGKMHFSNDQLKENFKKNIVLQFSGNRTIHLSDMTDIEYSAMITSMQALIQSVKGKYEQYDKARKQTIAAIGQWLRQRGIEQNINLIKGIACRAAKAEDFNKIPLSKLKAIIFEWNNKSLVSIETKAIMETIENGLSEMN